MSMTDAERTFARHSGDTTEFLAALGIEILPGPVVSIADAIARPPPYVHYSSVPVALTAYAIASPEFARGFFPKLRLVDLVARRPNMDGRDALALAAVCGVAIEGDAVAGFIAHLHGVVARHELGALFELSGRPACNGIDLRPRGIIAGGAVDPRAMADWRVAFNAMPPARQMLAATILWLYRGGKDETWLHARQGKWPAADAIARMRDAGGAPLGALRDWGKLMALYSGW